MISDDDQVDDENLFRLMEEEEHMAVSLDISQLERSCFTKRCSSTRRRRGRAWRRYSTWRWSTMRPTCLASGKFPQSWKLTFLQDLSGLLTPPWPRITPSGRCPLLHFSGKDKLFHYTPFCIAYIIHHVTWFIMMIFPSFQLILNYHRFLFVRIPNYKNSGIQRQSFILEISTTRKRFTDCFSFQ